MTSTILVAGIGNIFLGDDGFGPEVVRRLVAEGDAGAPEAADGVRIVDYGIRGMHLAYDLLDGCDTLVLVDAVPGDGPPGAVDVLEVDADSISAAARDGRAGLDAHSMDPVAVLSGVTALGGELPPTYVVGARPQDLDEGIGLSEPMAAAVPVAVDAVRTLLTRLREAAPESPDRPAREVI